MALVMQQPATLCKELESEDRLEMELPLRLRLRRSWSAADIWELRHATEEDCKSETHLDCECDGSCTPSGHVKLSDDSASTCDDDDSSSLTSEGTSADYNNEPESPKLNWAEQMVDSPAPKSKPRATNQSAPPGNWTMPCRFATTTLSPSPPGKWVSPLGTSASSTGEMIGPPGNFVSTLEAVAGPPGKLQTPPGRLAAPPGNLAGPPGKMSAPPGKLTAPPPGVLGSVSNLQQ